MSAVEFQRTISNFSETLMEQGLAQSIQQHTITELAGGIRRVTWAKPDKAVINGGEEKYSRSIDLELTEYLRCLRDSDYSILLNDGGMLKVSIDFKRNDIVASQFNYVPCAIKISPDELKIENDLYPLEDFIVELPQPELISRLCIRPAFRFEFDPLNAGEDHSLNHVHLGKSATRVPVSSHMCWDHFARFVFKNFYPELFGAVEGMLKFPVTHRPQTLVEHEALEMHFTLGFQRGPAAPTPAVGRKRRKGHH